jgi:peptide/nickel transport system permease protein
MLIFSVILRVDRSLISKIALPMDSIVMRFTEIFKAIPTLFLLLSIISFFKSQTLWSTAFIIGALGWPGILRLVRGEVVNIRDEAFIVNSKLMGVSNFRIMWRHIIPNILPVLLIAMTFIMAANILLEATLSFLGLGLPLDQPSWGGLLRQSREDFGAWWLAVFPGLMITFTLFSLNILAERYNNLTGKGF